MQKMLLILLFVFNFNLSACVNQSVYDAKKNIQSDSIVYHTVTRVVDGDTFEIETGEKVRLLGIDTPEKWQSTKLDRDSERTGKDKETIKKLGELASHYTESILLNQKVILLSDSTNSDSDRYGRLLRYCYLEDGTFFNLKIIEDGYAYAYTKYPIIYQEEFLEAQRTARENKHGLWGNFSFEELEDR